MANGDNCLFTISRGASDYDRRAAIRGSAEVQPALNGMAGRRRWAAVRDPIQAVHGECAPLMRSVATLQF